MTRLNHCAGSGVTAPGGGTQGGSSRHPNNRNVCPYCQKKIAVTRTGRLRVHGTRTKEAT